ncbi:Transcription antitermination protein NusB [Frankliniella fusca]|uniref:Transcription antitermination protein NusB n=1 Tax=Frankliniella fusca TaxID=407009 RepID=A0AAE1HXN0_9NEOP|nr:Transcription antitermination protein NusB [Frankliniella fusca]KAK3929747.1 Transcription antitermination protein NusB [Frankliniella fusca]
MSFKETLNSTIRKVLPHLEDEKVNATTDFLLKEGVKKLADLKHITVSMLKTVLDTIDSCELNADWQKTYAAGPSSTSSSSTPSEALSRPPLQDVARNVINTPLPIFDIQSPYMPSTVKDAVKAGKRPTSRGREQFVERIVDRCREVVPNLQRNMFKRVALQIVETYPDSFKDTLLTSSHGSDSLAHQLQVKFDNDRRPKAGKKTTTELEVPSSKQAFGCISWNPSLPSGQTLEYQGILCKDLKTMYKVSRRDWDWRQIRPKLQESFYLQRRDINGTLVPKEKKKSKRADQLDEAEVDEPEDKSILELQIDWPFLFTSKGINIHFHLLTGVDFSEKLSDFISETASDLIDFFTSRSGANDGMHALKRKMVLAEKQGHGNTSLCGVLLMLIEYLKDDKNELFTVVEATTSIEDAIESTTINYPEESTPFLIVAGTSIYDFEKIYFSCDKQVLSAVKSIFDALVILFTSYYVFNYMYNSKLSSLLLFMQRKIAGIEPASSASKCMNAQILKRANSRILQLSNKFEETRERWRNEDAKEN